MTNAPITDVIFDFCGVLLDWQTRACLEGHFDQDLVDAICADDDPHGFFRYEDRMDAGEDFDAIYPDVVREQGDGIAGVFRYYIGHYGDALPRILPGMVELLADLRANGYGAWGLTNWWAPTRSASTACSSRTRCRRASPSPPSACGSSPPRRRPSARCTTCSTGPAGR